MQNQGRVGEDHSLGARSVAQAASTGLPGPSLLQSPHLAIPERREGGKEGSRGVERGVRALTRVRLQERNNDDLLIVPVQPGGQILLR